MFLPSPGHVDSDLAGLGEFLGMTMSIGGCCRSGEGGRVAGESKSYAVREAGSPSRLGKVRKAYPYDLKSLLEALSDARFWSLTGGPLVVTVVTGRDSQVIRRFEGGKEAWSASTAEISGERGDGPQD
jgi:hypothetical protein